MKKIIISLILSLHLNSCSEMSSYVTNGVSPCSCWKRSDWIRHKEACSKAAENMGSLEWEKKVKACEDYRLKEDKTNGYTTIELVVINGTWTEVYVK